ncbi:membrane fusion protein CusB [Afipia carboxidovorans OM5]|jgi:Cu(I)/Ag(I) efflux system membrane fusion protein|uniref:Membrane fusion protein CusB n=1 Tax=Afipia carboxidovorans (strain ATCC 49405 / DSM 1227 / KCTC 32145 / OM5) TaxID=504832 RepID=F8BWB2_AFIC5|nr:efflux RND transporter periplasmic adaptor subunit [Afipia carboxidovorans]AEI01675.1 membrane fusion protein CusB [Afipia carboxidovorans OM4]AEI05250.1 membrane fusion protein CusB [Afipia carboxidovorans OM5]
MDKLTDYRPFENGHMTRRARTGRSTAKRIALLAFAICALAATLGLGYRLGHSNPGLPDWIPPRLAAMLGSHSSHPAGTGPVIYYRDPDGKALYSRDTRTTPDGRPYVAVYASEDVSFDNPPETAAPAQDANSGAKRILFYRNPMGLPDTSPVPKKDSMGMDYIPVYEGENDASTIQIPPGKLQRTGVRSEPASLRVVTRPVRAPGTIKLDERRVAVVSLRAQSFIESVENVTTGDHVTKGQPLLRLYSPDVASAGAQYLSIVGDNSGTANLAGRKQLIDGARRRLENLAVPADVIADIERTKTVPLTVTWTAPRDGVILERTAVEGMRAQPGDVLFRLADTSVIWVIADVAEQDIDAVKIGATATIKLRSLSGREFKGSVALIYPQVNIETRTTKVRIELPNPDGVLLPDMFADVEIASGAEKPVVAVPNGAVIDTGARQIVFIDKGEGRFEPRDVKVGTRGEDYTEIRDGIGEGDRVVVAANFLIDAESNLKSALRAFTDGEKSK